ncbi:MAG TPA: hypothetical protein VG603_11450 [Chitinophagales bacterium]|nr:hypothetical protein [Chitinophagales bacterium]
MKKHSLLLLAAIICAGILNAQDASKVFGSNSIVWYGVDFTQAKMIGMKDESPHKIRDEYFKQWNDVIIDVDLSKVFQKALSYKDPNGVIKRDMARETDNLMGTDDQDFTADKIADIVKAIPTGQKKEGLGVVFVVQSFNKETGMATVHVTFFDIATKAVLWTKKETGKAAGGSTVKAWSAALHNILSDIQKKDFSAWKKEANY